MSNLFQKINFFIRSWKIIKNWYAYPLCYFNLIKDPTVFHISNGPDLLIRSPNKFTDIHIFTEIWIDGEYDEHDFEINSNDTIIDIGAHTGFFSLKAATMCTKGKIFSYEALPANFEMLKKNLKLNAISNIHAKNIAVSKNNGKCKLYLKHDSTNSLVKKAENFIEIPTVNLEQIFDENNLNDCDLLKLDCEGSEYDILFNTNSKTLKKIKKICMEYHVIPEHNYTDKELISFLELNNFKVKKKNISKNTGMIFAINNSNV